MSAKITLMTQLSDVEVKPKVPVKNANADYYEIVATHITQELDEAGKVTLTYHTGVKVSLPEGYIGMITPNDDIAKISLGMCNAVQMIYPGEGEKEITLSFKVMTDALPRVYRPNDVIGKLHLLQTAMAPIFDIVEENTLQNNIEQSNE